MGYYYRCNNQCNNYIFEDETYKNRGEKMKTEHDCETCKHHNNYAVWYPCSACRNVNKKDQPEKDMWEQNDQK